MSGKEVYNQHLRPRQSIHVPFNPKSTEMNTNRVHKRNASNASNNENSENDNEEKHSSIQNLIQSPGNFDQDSVSLKSSTPKKIEKSNQKKQLTTYFGLPSIIIGFLLLVTVLNFFLMNSEEPAAITAIKNKYLIENEELWTSFEASVDDVLHYKRPVNFILLYEQKNDQKINNITNELSQYAIYKINKNTAKQPVILTNEYLNSKEVLQNYGIVIEDYKETLEERCVMIVRNLENVKGISAQIFHSYCDEVTPLVSQAVFIFTMKVEILPLNANRFVTNYFMEKWNDIDSEARRALLARISNMIINIT